MTGKPPEYRAYHTTISSYCESIKTELLHSSIDQEECTAVAYQKAYDFFQNHLEYSCNWGIIPLKSKWIIYNLFSQELEIFYACRKGDENEGTRHKRMEP